MKTSKILLLTSIFCGWLHTVQATETPWFEIELLIFEQSSQSRLESEKWDKNLTLPDTMNSLDFLTPDPATVPLQQLCLDGKMVPVQKIIPYTEVTEEPLIEETLITDPELKVPDLNQGFETEPALVTEVEEKPYIILEPELNQLNELKNTLKRRRGYRPLLHISWRQPVENKQNSQLIRIFSGKNYSEQFNPEGDARVNIAEVDPESLLAGEQLTIVDESQTRPALILGGDTPVADTMDTENWPDSFPFIETGEAELRKQHLQSCQQLFQKIADEKYTDVWELDGNIRIYVERYLHLETDMYLRLPGKEELEIGALKTSLAADKLLSNLDMKETETESTFGWQLGDDFLLDEQEQTTIVQDVLNKYVMQQSRRLRSNEIHYLDHPLFGILIQIRPYEKAEADDAISGDTLNNN